MQPVFAAKQKLLISQQSVSVNVERRMWQVIQKSNKRCDSCRGRWSWHYKKVLSTEDILSRSLFAITAIIESKEVHRHATATLCTVSAVSSFQHHTKQCFNLGDMSLASVKKSYSIDSKKQQLGMLNILELFVLLAETVKEG